MGKEIERKFLVRGRSYRDAAIEILHLAQGYISTDADATVRVRIADNKGFLTIKSRNVGAERGEWEYSIPEADALELLEKMCGGKTIIKTRYIIPYNGLEWEVDEFGGHLEGLVIAEVELTSVDSDIYPLPSFIGREVTGDERYYNSRLLDAVIPPCESLK